MIELPLKLAAGFLLDRFLGEPRKFHPLVGFGKWANGVEKRIRRFAPGRTGGVIAWSVAVLPWVLLAVAARAALPGVHWVADAGLLYFALGARSLQTHANAIVVPLADDRLDEARERVAMMVSRDTGTLDVEGVARAATESVLENGNDAVFGAIFWFCLLGGPGALLFRLANTLDAMWGYRTPRYLDFGWAAARIDDLMGWVPARLTALTYALLGNTRNALACWRTQAPAWKSPNAGPVMAAGAGALSVRLGGTARYHGRDEPRPPLGEGAPPDATSLTRALRLIHHGMLFWLAVVALAAAAYALLSTTLI